MSAPRGAFDFQALKRYGCPMDTFKIVNMGAGARVWVRRRLKIRGPR